MSSQTQPQVTPQRPPQPPPLIGRWTYRSFWNNPDISVEFGNLEFGRGELLVEYLAPGLFIGRLIFGDTYQFRLQGATLGGDVPSFRFQGVGDAPDSEGHVYDYFACLMPMWPHGVDQRLAMAGSVIRSVAHSDGQAPAGLVSSFIAVKR